MEYNAERIDAHEHFRKGGNLKMFLKVAKKFNISKIVFVPTGRPPSNLEYKSHMKELFRLSKIHPEIIPFATIDENDGNSERILLKAIKNGAKGLKLIGYHRSFSAPPLTDEKMIRIFKICSKFQLPVLIHIDLYKFPHLLTQFEKILFEFPEINFIAAHYAKLAKEKIQLKKCGNFLDAHENLFIDLSMGGGTKTYLKNIHYQPKLFRKFITKYYKKIVWGSDCILRKESREKIIRALISTHINVLEKKTFFSPLSPEKIKLYGLNLSKRVLKYIYKKNPEKILKI